MRDDEQDTHWSEHEARLRESQSVFASLESTDKEADEIYKQHLSLVNLINNQSKENDNRIQIHYVIRDGIMMIDVDGELVTFEDFMKQKDNTKDTPISIGDNDVWTLPFPDNSEEFIPCEMETEFGFSPGYYIIKKDSSKEDSNE